MCKPAVKSPGTDHFMCILKGDRKRELDIVPATDETVENKNRLI